MTFVTKLYFGLLVGYLLSVFTYLLVDIVTHSVFIMMLSLEPGRSLVEFCSCFRFLIPVLFLCAFVGMAPSKKLNRGASVSYDQTRFRSKAKEDRYNDSYANRPIQSEWHVRISDFADTPIP
ncbi:hypothetical protein U1Q18_031164 [Sarracenia purpurea var. burkii]